MDLPTDVPIEVSQAPDGTRFEGAHDGYVKSYGLTHARTLEMTFDGRAMAGEELLVRGGGEQVRDQRGRLALVHEVCAGNFQFYTVDMRDQVDVNRKRIRNGSVFGVREDC